MPLILLNKPYRVLSQFRDENGRQTLAEFVNHKEVYPAGRLDFESEGLLLLSDDGRLQARISQPKSRTSKTYWAHVEGNPSAAQLENLAGGVMLRDGFAAASSVKLIPAPARLWTRNPPIRQRLNVSDHWLEIVISEGRNRQVRRMTAAVGLPTLRLIREAVGPWSLGDLQPGQTKVIDTDTAWASLRAAET